MSLVYGNLAAKKAMANAMSAAGKIKYEYDSDEDTEGGKSTRCLYDRCTYTGVIDKNSSFWYNELNNHFIYSRKFQALLSKFKKTRYIQKMYYYILIC